MKYECETWVADTRCTDGCCGDVALRVRSPKTGRVVSCSIHLAGATIGNRVNFVIRPSQQYGMARNDRSGHGYVSFSVPELRQLLALDGQFDPS